MGVTALHYKTKTIVTADGNAVALFSVPTYVYSIAIEIHEDSTETTAWCGVTAMTTTNKDGRAFSKTTPCEFKTRWREGSGKTSNLIDASTIFVCSPTGGEILVTYLEHVTT